ncbi:LysR family transcriptional regulator [Mycobacterium sp. WMMD1722]|uniref:LysR family transcriptional regulator n=1 Tax=Mycobacterium sp. WMMD1722 TaxID=3404117 RepID=UPI003BF4D022
MDLNLIPALAMLLDERSVSRAAEAVGLSQSAMSRALQRLRRTLDDDLLVRADSGYRLTPAAEQLKVELNDIIPRLSEMFFNRDLDPAKEARAFRIAASDYAIAAFGSHLFTTVVSSAPNASLRFSPWHANAMAALSNGDVDVVFSGIHVRPPLRSELLFTDTMVAVVARDHPWRDHASVGLDDYLAARHLMIDMMDGMQPSIDAVLSARGEQRRPGLTMPYHGTAPAALPGTDLVLSIPARVLPDFVDRHREELRVLDLPTEVRALPYYMSWHPRADHDKGHRWLRRLVIGAVTALDAAPAADKDARPPSVGEASG